MYVVKAPYSGFSGELLNEVQTKWLKVGGGRPLYFVSFCPWRRSWARKFPALKVLNPYKYRFWGELTPGILWLDQWPSFCAHKWSELRFHLLAHQDYIIFQQSFGLKGEEYLFKATFDVNLPKVLYEESLPRLKVIPLPRLVLERYCGEGKRGHLLMDKDSWPVCSKVEIFNPHCLWQGSETWALAGRQRMLLAVARGLHSWRFWSLTELILAWLLSGQLTPDLINWLRANKSRRNSHSQGSLSGAPRDWHASFKKWSFSIRTILWRTRWGKKTQGLDSRAWLHDESGACSHSLHQRAS